MRQHSSISGTTFTGARGGPGSPAALAIALGLSLALAVGCSGSDDEAAGSGSDGAGTGGRQAASVAGTGSSSGTGGGSSSASNNTACGLSSASGSSVSSGTHSTIAQFEACAAEAREAEAVSADIFILLDQSVSMGEHTVPPLQPGAPTRWEVITRALEDFIASSSSAGLRVGIQYFGLGDYGDVSCDPEDYAEADVAIGALADNAAALLASIDAHRPSNFTPSAPALEGALLHAKRWATDNPGRPTVVVFATDGYPTECEPRSVGSLVELARAYANPTDGSPRVPTFVLGLGEIENLEAVALAGGTGKAFFVGDCPTAVEDLKTSLERVATSPALCEFELPQPPEGEFLDKSKVNMVFTPASTGQGEVVHQVPSSNGCTRGGWYYDDNDEPTKVNVCPSTCSRFGGGVVELIVGCATVSLR